MSTKVIKPTAMKPSAIEALAGNSASLLATIREVEYAMNSKIETQWVGTTAKRPPLKGASNTAYFDTTIGVPIWFNGTIWIDAAGNVA